MIAPELKSSDEEIKLIAPNIERDAHLGVRWLQGDSGRRTLKLMGVTDHENIEPTLDQERERVDNFINGKDKLNWMIECAGKVVGSVWVDLKESTYLDAPSIHIMIGDTSMRGKGVGSKVIRIVADYLIQQGEKMIYSRHLVENENIKSLLKKLGFSELEKSYKDNDGLIWQNVVLVIE